MDQSIFDPIPVLTEVVTGRQAETLDITEPLVDIADYSAGLIRCSLHDDPQDRPLGGRCYLRLAVVDRIMRAQTRLPEGLRFEVIDAWRSRAEQERIFEEYAADLRARYPDWSESQLHIRATQFVTDPMVNAPPHCTGGAVDITIRSEDGAPVWFGTAYDDFSPKASTRYYEDAVLAGERLSLKEQDAMANRRILFNSLAQEGLTNYPDEWWHFDYGDSFWAQVVGEPALYGVARAPDES